MPPKVGRSCSVQIMNFGAATGGPDTTFIVKSILGRDDFGGDALKMEFEVSKSLDSEANRCTLRIYNLSELNRGRVSGLVKRKVGTFFPVARTLLYAGGPPEIVASNLGVAYLRIAAGYTVDMFPIFEGTTEKIEHWQPDNVTWITELSAGDGRKALEESTINKSFAPGTPAVTILGDIIKHLGVIFSPIDLQIAVGGFTRAVSTPLEFPFGYTAQGSTYDNLRQILELADVQWSIQDGEFAVYDEFRTLPFPPVELGPGTGLVGKPTRGDAGIVYADALLDWRFRPGQQVLMASREVKGAYRVNAVHHNGDTYGEGPWQSRLELEDLLALQTGILE
jgi:hypothetical protein